MRLTARLIALLERANETLERMDRREAQRESKPKQTQFPSDFERHKRSVQKTLATLPPTSRRRRA